MIWFIAISGIVISVIAGFAVARYLTGRRRWLGIVTLMALPWAPFLIVLAPDFQRASVDPAYHTLAVMLLLAIALMALCLTGLLAGALANLVMRKAAKYAPHEPAKPNDIL